MEMLSYISPKIQLAKVGLIRYEIHICRIQYAPQLC